MTPEGRVKKALKERLSELGAYHFWPVQMGYGDPCVDCLGCYKGQFFGIETKASGKTATLRQQLVLSAILASEGQAYVVDSVEGAREFSFDNRFQADRKM